LRFICVNARKTGQVEPKKSDTMLVNILVPLGICVVLPVLIVWLVSRVKRNETDRKAEILLKAVESGATLDPGFFKDHKAQKTIKERLLERLTAACVTSLLGVAFLTGGILLARTCSWSIESGPASFMAIAGGILLAIGIAFFIVFFTSKKMLSDEIEDEKKRISESE